ncbi:MAG: hypothetical protein NTY09_01870 [bacterium]|nr:hypothetical protein [bacterium]
MNNPETSSVKVHYELRPAKQVQRRMLIDSFLLLSAAGFNLRDYRYTGLGATYFVDFILFHKLLGINRMCSAEHDLGAAKRVIFNKPFDCIEIVMDKIGNVIPSLDQQLKHILWLDYDFQIDGEVITDIKLAGAYLTEGSIFLITVDVGNEAKEFNRPEEIHNYFLDQAGAFLGSMHSTDDFTKAQLPRINTEIINRAIKSGLSGRNLKFIPLYHFLYADGHQMLTIGGIIGGLKTKRTLTRSGIFKNFYIRQDLDGDPYEIRVPKLSRKERQYLDSMMPATGKQKECAFELPLQDIEAYKEIYRFMPVYAELLL